MIIIAGHLMVHAGERDRFVDAHRDLVVRARAADGCIDLAITADPIDPGRVNNLEIWRSTEDLHAWRARVNAPEHGIAVTDAAMRRYDASEGGSLF